jgi:hypothetical protein
VSRPYHPRHKMIAELPSVHCKGAAGSIKRRRMQRVRSHFVSACGTPSTSFKTLHGRTRIKGVAFFDIPHGQSGHAPNYIELHPLLRFRMIVGHCGGGGGGGPDCDPSTPTSVSLLHPPDLDCADVAPHHDFTVIGCRPAPLRFGR